jgi:hypothetical protein
MATDFAKTLELLLNFFTRNGLDYALIGGFALNAYGLARNTNDIDFILRNRDAQRSVGFLESIGYHTLLRTDAFSNHEHPMPGFSRIDFMYVNGDTADTIFREARNFSVLTGFQVRVVKPEHLIALKLFSLASNPERTALDREDLIHLLRQEGLDREEIRKYFVKYSTLDLLKELEGNSGD